MSTPLPPELAKIERALEETRARLPTDLRARVLAAAARTRAMVQLKRSSLGWFAASLAVAAALLLSFSSSSAIASPEPIGAAEIDPCVFSRALHEAPERCLGQRDERR